MLVKDIEILVTKIERKKNSKTGADYLAIGLLTLDDGSNFTVLERDEDKFGQYAAMVKYIADLRVSSSQYGVSVAVEELKEPQGSII